MAGWKPGVSQDLFEWDAIGWKHEDSSKKIFSQVEGWGIARSLGRKGELETADPCFGIDLITSIEGSPAIEELIYDDSHAPDIHSVVICDLVFSEAGAEHLNGIEFESPHPCILILLLEFFLIDSEPKVGQEYLPVEPNQDVLRLQISMNDSLFMKLHQCWGELIANSLSNWFFHRFIHRVGEFVEVSIDVIGEDYAQRVLIHNDVCEVNAAFNFEDLVQDFDLSSQWGKDVFLSHLLSIHFLDAD